MPRQIPEFVSEAEERAFWATHDVTDYFDFQTARNLPEGIAVDPGMVAITFEIPRAVAEDLKTLCEVDGSGSSPELTVPKWVIEAVRASLASAGRDSRKVG